MTLAEVCDVAYVLLIDRLERQAVAGWAAGAEIDPAAERDRFDAELAAPLGGEAVVDPERFETLRSLGLR